MILQRVLKGKLRIACFIMGWFGALVETSPCYHVLYIDHFWEVVAQNRIPLIIVKLMRV